MCFLNSLNSLKFGAGWLVLGVRLRARRVRGVGGLWRCGRGIGLCGDCGFGCVARMASGVRCARWAVLALRLCS